MPAGDLDPDEARTALYEIMNRDIGFEEKVAGALEIGEAYFGVENGHLARIDISADFWEAIVSTDSADGEYPPGLILEYQDTYCRSAVEKGETVAVHDAPNQGLADSPAYQKLNLRTYSGTPIRLDGDLYGTVCFVDSESREPFDESEVLFAELIARMIEHELKITHRRYELSLANGVNTVLSRVLRHNIRNDLNVVQGILGILNERAGGSDGLYEQAQNRLDDLLYLSDKARRIESIAHATRFDRRPIELTRLVESVIDEVRSAHPDASLSVETRGEIGMEAMPTIRRALRELIENAAKHAGDDPVVRVTIREIQTGVEIGIADNGPGLPDQERRVLDEGTETPLVHGSGLGLWLTYLVVAQHDGRIDTEVTDHGTAVTVTIPRDDTPPDITDYDKVLRMFNRAEDRFEAAFEHALDAIVIADDEGRYIEANPSASDLFGVRREELLGRRIDEFAPREFDFGDAWTKFGRSERERGEFPLVRPDGTERVVEYGASSEIMPGEHLSVLRDVTARKERERRFSAIFDNMYQFTGLLDAEGRILEANETALEFGGLDPADVIGEEMWETAWFQATSRTRQKAKAAVERAIEGETGQEQLEVQGRTDEVMIDFSVRPVLDDRGEVEFIVAEGRDISHLRPDNGSAGVTV